MPTYNQELDDAVRRLADATATVRVSWPLRNQPGFDIQPYLDELREAGTAFNEIQTAMWREQAEFAPSESD